MKMVAAPKFSIFVMFCALLASGLALPPGSAMAAGDYFRPCHEVFRNRDFAAMSTHWTPAKPLGDVEPDMCMRLSNTEFLYTVSVANAAGNLYYCNFASVQNACSTDDPTGTSFYPGLAVIRQFSGAQGKQYVLTSTHELRHGIYRTDYQVFNLAPKKIASRGYVFYGLSIGSENVEGDLAASCNNEAGNDGTALGVAFDVEEPEIENEGTASVLVVFHVTSLDCATMQRDEKTVKFGLRDGKFQRQ